MPEISITPNFLNPSEFKDIDIFIRKGNEFAVIIENKIDALDSNHEEEGQLEKYYRESLEEGYSKDNINIYYLTLDQHEPSEEVFQPAEIPRTCGKSTMYLLWL